ncbi:MAG: flagellar basal-body rod protein FlgF [Desulforhopalus sp.]
MASGKYSALTGAIAREQAIANITNNLANISTSGYKKSRVSFASVLNGQQQMNETNGINYNRIRRNFTDYSTGSIRATGDPLDLVIEGEGFFKLQGPSSILYSRRGDMAISEEGLLTTSNGLPVLDAQGQRIIIDNSDSGTVAVDGDGTIYLLDSEGDKTDRTEVARLAVINIEDKLQLTKESDTTFSLDNPFLEVAGDNYRVIQGSLEVSNVNMTEELTRMIASHRIFETYHNVLKSYSTISEQQEELGNLG